MSDSPAMSRRTKSPGAASGAARPAQCHWRLKIVSRSRAKISGEV
jgi:hypothetical protein